MVVVVIVLGFSFLASCIMHIHLMRLKRRQILLQEEQQSQGGEAQELTNFNPTIPAPRCIDPNVLKSFPTRLYREQKKVQEGIGGSDGTKEGNEDLGKKEVSATETAVVVMAVGVEDHDANDSENPDSLLPHSISGSTLHLGASSLLGEDTFLELPLASETSTPHIKTTTAAAPHTPHTTASQQEDAACCICLETFSTEDIVRDLPCSHTYHSRCIDQWLTVKSSCCPLCKRDYF